MNKKNIYLICVGKLKSTPFKNTEKRILYKTNNNYNVNIIEIESEKNDKLQRASEIEKIKEKEALRILSSIPKNTYIVTLEIKGKKIKSIKGIIDEIDRDICFIVGGSVGLSQKVSNLSNKKISFSDMTFPHALIRLIMLEQINS